MEEWQRRNAPTVVLGGALVAAAVLLGVLCWNLTFFQDTWAFLLERQGSSAGDFLRPHNEHLVVLSVVVTKLSVGIFGMTSPRPETVVMILTLTVSAVLLFIYLRRRIGPCAALLAVLPILFLGSSWMILLWPFEIEFTGAMMAGLGALLLLEREDGPGDVWASVLLTVSIGFGSLGLSFAVAAIIDVFQRRHSRGLRRACLVIVPITLYLVWYAGWGHTAAHHLSLHNGLISPRFLCDGLANSVASLLGLSTATGAGVAEPVWGRPLLIGLVALAIFYKWRKPGISPRFWPAAAAALSYWLFAAFNYIPGREATSNRYVYAGAIFMLMMAADLLQGVRPDRRVLWIATLVALAAVGANLGQMKEGGEILKEQSQLTRADTAALEIARRTVPRELALTPENAGTLANVAIVPGPYLEAVEAHGSPAYSLPELAAAPAGDRYWADILLSKALPLSISTRAATSAPRDAAACSSSSDGSSGADEVQLRPGLTKIWIAPGPGTELMVRRFATNEYPVDLGSAPGDSISLLRIPPDEASQPWYLHFEPSQRGLVCR